VKPEINPMHPKGPDPSRLNRSLRCGAKTRRAIPCRSPAVKGRKRCRMHGGTTTSGAPKGEANGNYQHGGFTCEAIKERRLAQALIQQAKRILGGLG
jgi:hypothetical protein